MPRLRQPVALEAASLRAVGALTAAAGRAMQRPVCALLMCDAVAGQEELQRRLRTLNETLFASVPWYLYDSMAHEVLAAVSQLIQDTKNDFNINVDIITDFMNRMNVVVSLTEVAVHPHLKNIDISRWPKIMRNVLYKNLHRMTGLESLNLGSASSGWKTSDVEKQIASAIATMHALTSLTLCFDCTDYILSLVGEACPLLQKLDVTSSRSVTNRSVTHLLQCTHLRELFLNRTSVTVEGFARLLQGLHALEDLGRCNELGQVLEYAQGLGTTGPFGLRSFESKDVAAEHLDLLVKMCPHVTSVSIFHDERISDLTMLANLNDLQTLKLLSCDFFADRVKQLLEVKGQNLTWLHLEHVEEIDLNALMYISQFCPNLKQLTFCNCEFLDHTSLSYTKLIVPPFQYLERIVCLADCALLHLEFLLSNCFNIKFIQLGSSTGIGDETMRKVLLRNPMSKLEELRILFSHNLSMQTVQLLMTHCRSLRVLSELESWQGISERELIEFKNYLATSNIDLDVRPTLSY